MAINKSFSDLVDQDTATIRHPDSKKRALSVVEVRRLDTALLTARVMISFLMILHGLHPIFWSGFRSGLPRLPHR